MGALTLLVPRKWQLQEEEQELLLYLQGCSAHIHCSLRGVRCVGPVRGKDDRCIL